MGETGTSGAWNSDYRKRGRLWGGAARNIPVIPPGSRVLELGCGNGKTFAALTGKDCDVVGIDFSAQAVALCNRSFGSNGQSHTVVADARHLPFIHDSFDIVFAIHVAGHLDVPGRSALSHEVMRVLRPGGSLLFSGFSTRDFRAANGILVAPGTVIKGNGIATHYFTLKEVTGLFSGFSCEDCTVHHWNLTVRGRKHSREEIIARFKKRN